MSCDTLFFIFYFSQVFLFIFVSVCIYMFLLHALKTFFALSTCLLKKLCPETCQLITYKYVYFETAADGECRSFTW